MEVRQLAYFVAVVEEASFTRAARRIHVAQPAISRQIAQLERELGEPLLQRSRTRIELTPAGKAFLDYARAALGAIADGRAAVADLGQTLTGKLTVGSVQGPPMVVVEALASFTRRFPAVEVMIRIDHTETLASDLSAGLLDAAILASGSADDFDESFDELPLASEPLVVALAPTHPLAQKRSISLDALRKLPLLTLPHGSGLRALLDAACADAGFVPRVATETDDIGLLVELAEHDLGVAVLPQTLAARAQHPIAILRLRQPTLRRHTTLVTLAGRASPTGRAFQTHLRHVLDAARGANSSRSTQKRL